VLSESGNPSVDFSSSKKQEAIWSAACPLYIIAVFRRQRETPRAMHSARTPTFAGWREQERIKKWKEAGTLAPASFGVAWRKS
jgi:hypothetical protein